MPTLHLIDGSGYLFRAYHALPKLTNAQGEPTGSLFGVVNMLRKMLAEEQPSHAAFVFDASGPTFRDALYSEYKSNRPAMPQELREQIEPLLQLVAAMGFPVLRISGVEADDVIGTLTLQALQVGMQVQIASGDKDLTQLVGPNVLWVNTMSQERLDAAGVKLKHGVPPELITDYLALMGDSVDNVPGVDKCGPKTAAKWLAEYGSLAGVIARANEVGGKIGENLRAALPQLPLSHALTRVKTDCELPYTPQQLSLRAPDVAALKTLYQRYGFNQALRELTGTAAATPKVCVELDVAKNYQLLLTLEQCRAWCTRMEQAGEFSLVTLTSSNDPHLAELVGIAFAVAPGEAAYLPFTHRHPGVVQQLDRELTLRMFKPLLESPLLKKVGYHGKYTLHMLARCGIELQGYAHDAMLASYVFNSTAILHNLDALAKQYLGYTTIKYEQVVGKGAKQISFSDVALDAALAYAAEHADLTLRLSRALLAALSQSPELLAVYQQLEVPLVPVLVAMEHAGVLVDRSELRRQSQELGASILKLEQQAHQLAGRSFSLDSPKQLQVLLFDELKLPITQKTPSGQASTNEDALDALREHHPLAAVILEHRGLAKLKNTYTDKLPELTDSSGRVHTSYHQAIAATGRLSSFDPNLQNIPIRTAEGRRIRRAFIAPEGWLLLAADYSQIELRIMAHLSDDPGLLSAFASGIDVHRATAAEVFGIEPEQVDGNQRRAAKAINFGLIYGMSPFGLARNLSISRDLARQYVDRYFARYPGVKRYMEETRKQAHEQGYVETTFGRRLYLPDLGSRNYNLRQGAERAAINAPMQGTAADIIKRAMLDLHPWLSEHSDQIRMLLQVHDELIFEVRADAVQRFQPGIIERMSGAAQLKVPLVVDVGVGMSWDEAH